MNNSKTEKICEHTPSSQNSKINRFFDFLLHSKKLYYRPDDTGVCSSCQTPLLVPKAYYHPLTKISYFLFSILAFWLTVFTATAITTEWDIFLLFILIVAVCTLAMLLYNKLLTALIFSLCPWIPYDEQTADIERLHRCAKNNRFTKFTALLFGCSVYNVIDRLLPIAPICFIASLVCIIIILVRKKGLDKIIIHIGVFIYSIVTFALIMVQGFKVIGIVDLILSSALLLLELYLVFDMDEKRY